MFNHICACLQLTHSRRHNTFAEIKWLQCVTHFAEAGFCFHRDGVWVNTNAQPVSYGMMPHGRLLNLEKEVSGCFLVKKEDATVTLRPSHNAVSHTPPGRQAILKVLTKGQEKRNHDLESKIQNTGCAVKYISCSSSVARGFKTPRTCSSSS